MIKNLIFHLVTRNVALVSVGEVRPPSVNASLRTHWNQAYNV